MEYEMINVSKSFKRRKENFFFKATQEYIKCADIGHYKYFIISLPSGSGRPIEDGDIVKTSWSVGAARHGKINITWLNKEFKNFYREYMHSRKIRKKWKL